MKTEAAGGEGEGRREGEDRRSRGAKVEAGREVRRERNVGANGCPRVRREVRGAPSELGRSDKNRPEPGGPGCICHTASESLREDRGWILPAVPGHLNEDQDREGDG